MSLDQLEKTHRLPRVICDKCMVDAKLSIALFGSEGGYGGRVLLECHDEELLVPLHKFKREISNPLPPVIVYSELAKEASQLEELDGSERGFIKTILGSIEELRLVHRVRRNHGRSPTHVDRKRLDELIDTLLLFRTEDPT